MFSFVTVSEVGVTMMTFAILILLSSARLVTRVDSFSTSDYSTGTTTRISRSMFKHFLRRPTAVSLLPQSPATFCRSPSPSPFFLGPLAMSSQPPPSRQPPRRLLKKRRRRGESITENAADVTNNGQKKSTNSAFSGQLFQSSLTNSKVSTSSSSRNLVTSKTMGKFHEEVRPLIKSVSRERGTDYWIDPIDYEREQRREQERLQRRQRERERRGGGKDKMIPDEKLWSEVKAPYRQNWIGYFSVLIAVLSMIVVKFPELLESPTTIQYPDL